MQTSIVSFIEPVHRFDVVGLFQLSVDFVPHGSF